MSVWLYQFLDLSSTRSARSQFFVDHYAKGIKYIWTGCLSSRIIVVKNLKPSCYTCIRRRSSSRRLELIQTIDITFSHRHTFVNHFNFEVVSRARFGRQDHFRDLDRQNSPSQQW